MEIFQIRKKKQSSKKLFQIIDTFSPFIVLWAEALHFFCIYSLCKVNATDYYLQVGNALVCISVYSNYTMRTVTNIFIVNLAVADFFVILFCLPPTVVWDVTETWFLGESMCKVVLYFQVGLLRL